MIMIAYYCAMSIVTVTVGIMTPEAGILSTLQSAIGQYWSTRPWSNLLYQVYLVCFPKGWQYTLYTGNVPYIYIYIYHYVPVINSFMVSVSCRMFPPWSHLGTRCIMSKRYVRLMVFSLLLWNISYIVKSRMFEPAYLISFQYLCVCFFSFLVRILYLHKLL